MNKNLKYFRFSIKVFSFVLNFQVTKSLRDTINEIQIKMGKRMYEMCLSGRLPEGQDLLLKEDIIKIKR